MASYFGWVIRKLRICKYASDILISHAILHHTIRTNSTTHTRPGTILTLGSAMDLLYSVRGYRNISFKDKVI